MAKFLFEVSFCRENGFLRHGVVCFVLILLFTNMMLNNGCLCLCRLSVVIMYLMFVKQIFFFFLVDFMHIMNSMKLVIPLHSL